MQLYFAHFSPPARTALMTIRNLGLEVDLKHVDFLKGENKSEDFLKLNPLGQVPVLVEDDGFVLTESRAISIYLVSSRNPESALYPKDPSKRAICDQMLYYDADVVFRSHIDILVGKPSFYLTWVGHDLLPLNIAYLLRSASDGYIRRP